MRKFRFLNIFFCSTVNFENAYALWNFFLFSFFSEGLLLFFLVKFGFFFNLQRFALSWLCEGCRILPVHNKIDSSQLFSPTSRTNSSNYSVTELLKRNIHGLVVGLSAPSPSLFTIFSLSSLSSLTVSLSSLPVYPALSACRAATVYSWHRWALSLISVISDIRLSLI